MVGPGLRPRVDVNYFADFNLRCIPCASNRVLAYVCHVLALLIEAETRECSSSEHRAEIRAEK